MNPITSPPDSAPATVARSRVAHPARRSAAGIKLRPRLHRSHAEQVFGRPVVGPQASGPHRSACPHQAHSLAISIEGWVLNQAASCTVALCFKGGLTVMFSRKVQLPSKAGECNSELGRYSTVRE